MRRKPMSNGNELINELTYKAQIKAMPDRALQEFTAEKIFELTTITKNHESRIAFLENVDKRMIGLVGGVASIIGAIIASIVNYFVK